MHTYKFPHKFVLHALLITIIFGTMYGLLQQQDRMQANDMPELLATQAAKQLDAGFGLQSIQMGATDLANHPVPFVVVYDKKGNAVAGSGYLNKKLATMPKGVVNHATTSKPHAVTWAPRNDIRIASVTVAAKEYYVTGGQSLAATEHRAERNLLVVAVGYFLALLTLAASALLFSKRTVSTGGKTVAAELAKPATALKKTAKSTNTAKPAKTASKARTRSK